MLVCSLSQTAYLLENCKIIAYLLDLGIIHLVKHGVLQSNVQRVSEWIDVLDQPLQIEIFILTYKKNVLRRNC